MRLVTNGASAGGELRTSKDNPAPETTGVFRIALAETKGIEVVDEPPTRYF